MITPEEFFNAWKDECLFQRDALLREWENSPNYTNTILRNHPEGSVIANVARRVGLKSYCEYYKLDAILYANHDEVRGAPRGETWVHSIQVAFEHEGHFRSGLFQETSHLLITRADLRVLVTYPEEYATRRQDVMTSEFTRIAEIIRATNLSDQPFLLITGLRTRLVNDEWTDIEWKGYRYSDGGWPSHLVLT